MVIISEKLAEEIGWHIGDGSMNYYKHDGKHTGLYQLRGHIEEDKDHYLTRIKPLFEELYGNTISLREMPSTRVFGFQIWNNDIVNFKHSLGLPLGKKYELEIPKEFLIQKELLVASIQGIFDTDGCLYLENKNHKLYPHIQITTISLKLSTQLAYLLGRLGLRITTWIEKPRGNRLHCYRLDIKGVEMLHKFFAIVQPKNPKHLAKYNRFLNSFPKT